MFLRGLGHPALVLILVFLALPLVVPYFSLASSILAFGLFASAFDLLLGHVGLLSFGHAAFFGLGAYTAGVLAKMLDWPLPLCLLGAMLVAGLAGLLIGALSLRQRGVAFAMLTLAFAQMIFFAAHQLRDLTGGDDGLRGIPIRSLGVPGGWELRLDNSLSVYVLVAIVVWLALLALRQVLDSPFGHVLRAVRENEARARACGYDTQRVQLLAFVLSATFSGLAGALYAFTLYFVGLETLGWALSGYVALMAILGGSGTLFGPLVGAAAFVVLRDVASTITDSWQLYVGAAFVLCVLVFPRGIWGTLQDFVRQRRRAGPAGRAAPAPSPGTEAAPAGREVA
jgi:branched-chain amino acid transport system permease protein